ncbi:MAG: Na+/H+ antiporter NhaC family protein [Eubacteriales bacterium]|nr:Na+/H+ antiporter NhaC family protein [Eubacteriales bacterium]
MKKQANAKALLPILVFLVLYLGLGIVFEYVMKISMGFYSIPIVVVFLIALLVACLQNKELKFDEKIAIMGQGVGDKNIMTMILIFLAAGVFVGVTGRSSAEAVAYFLLSVTPAWTAVAVLFVASCFVSTAMGTSCGTITLIVPIAVAVSNVSGFSLPLCIGSVMGGAMFGDNLSFISDTTIAACNTQGCAMKDKFRANFKIALPAAIVTLVLILVSSRSANLAQIEIPSYNMLLLIPYVLVLVGGIIGWNVFVVLLIGILSGSIIVLTTGTVDSISLLGNMGSGASGMFETILVTILVSSMCGLIREYGGFESLLAFIRRTFKGSVGGRLGVGLLVGAMDIATANNTVAIVMAGPIAKEISDEYGISPKESASLLDTFSCVFQGIIPYGAQMLLAISAAAELGGKVSAFEIIPCLFYPFLLAISSVVFIIINAKKPK